MFYLQHKNFLLRTKTTTKKIKWHRILLKLSDGIFIKCSKSWASPNYRKNSIYFLKTHGILKTGCLSGKACATLTPTHADFIVDHTPNKDRNGLFQLFRTMLTNSKSSDEITRLRHKVVPLRERKKKTPNTKNL